MGHQLTISNILEHIFNTIIHENNISNWIKCAIVTPIHKGGDETTINYYRLICVLHIFSNMLERTSITRLLSC